MGSPSRAFFIARSSLWRVNLASLKDRLHKDEKPMKILVRNLARNTTEEELHKLFSAHGTLQSCTLVMDKETGESKGFAFIEMPKVGEVKVAIKALNGIDLDGNKIRVKKAEDKTENKSDQ
jgi:RNA recognition motif-containing protein